MILEGVRIIAILIIAFIAALTLTPFVTNFLKKVHAGKQIRVSKDAPIFSSLHKKKEGTLTMGGTIVWLTVFILMIGFFVLDKLFDGFWGYFNFVDRAQTYLPLAAFFIAAALGFFDDIMGVLRIGDKGGGMRVSHKMLIYFCLAIVGAWWFYSKLEWREISIPFLGNFEIGFWYVPIFIFIILASAFSANETDGLDGLWGGVSLFIFAALLIISFAMQRFDLAAMIGAILGALLAFLWFNIYPARFFMGDTGAMALGITMGVIAMLTNTVLLLPIFAAVPLMESGSVIIQTFYKRYLKRKFFLSTPIHHHFEACGWPESQVTMRFWIISVIGMGFGLAIFFLDRLFL
ncbi:MAG: phospho-N-acetylmuramoyl-pentapeptide-transferase [Candidatus Colwellbacteria bacterium]|nr:phospho-N-acetylmuramoyl-pentapeptide-transferase [Candidatus Colwellbacteria bacterium]